MKTNCKKWKYLLITTAVVTSCSAVPVITYAADSKTKITDSEVKTRETTTDKMNSNNTAAGAAIILDTNIYLDDTEIEKLIKESAASIVKKEEEKKTESTVESTLVMARVNQYVNIRESATQDSDKVGVLYKDCGGDILEQTSGWTKIKSGDVTGWVSNDYLYFGDDAKEVAKNVGILTAYANTETLRVRREASTSSSILGLLSEGEALEAISEDGDWVCVSYEGATGYVSAEYVNVKFELDTAESIAAIKAREEAEKKKAQEKANAERIAKKEAAIATGDELRILAALIQCEAGGEPYEGQVAVGAVVMNRVRCGAYPNNITDVIYASGQFVPASKGKMESLILNGNIKASCVQAAQEAINGTTNVGDSLHFRRNDGRNGIVIGNHVFW